MTWFRVGGAGIPAALKNAMNAVFNKKFGTSGQNYPPKQWPDEVNLLGPLPEGTATGSIAHITDGADTVPIKSWEVEIAPTLSGKSAIECTQSGDSVFFPSDIVQGSISVSGYNAESTTRIRTEARKAVSPSTAYLIKCNSEILIYEVHEYQELTGSSTYTTVNATETTITTKATTAYMRILFRYSNNATITPSALKYIQCTTGTLSPYTVSTVNLGRTIHGGTAYVVNGEGKETCARIDMGDLTWQYDSVNTRFFTVGLTSVIEKGSSGWKTELISDLYATASGTATDKTISEYASTGYVYIKDTDYTDPNDFKTHVTGHYLVYPLATSTDFTFTPITPSPETALGTNNFWADEGDTTVVYRRDIDLALQAVSSSRGLMMASRPVTQLVGEESDPDQVNELVENDEIEQEGEDDAR